MKTNFFVLILLFSTKLFAQDTTHLFAKHHFWASAGGGISNHISFSGNLGATYLFNNKHAFQINYCALSSLIQGRKNIDELESVFLSYGINKSVNRQNSFIFSAGPSYGKGLYNYRTMRYEYFGFHISGQYLLRTRFYGFGLKIYCNIHKYTDFGLMFSQNVGYLNKKRQ